MGTQSIFPNYFNILIFTGRWQQDGLRLRYLRLNKIKEHLDVLIKKNKIGHRFGVKLKNRKYRLCPHFSFPPFFFSY